MGLVFLAQRIACAKAQSTVNPGNFWWEKGGGFALVGKKQRVQGTPASPSDMGLIWQGSSERLWHWGWAQELCLASAGLSLTADTGR